jgi:hypothetical protein
VDRRVLQRFPGTNVGCDLETIEPRADAFVGDFFTANEQTLVERTPAEKRSLLVTLLWNAKESALKALNVGLRLDTTYIDVNLTHIAPEQTEDLPQNLRAISLPVVAPAGWSPLQARAMPAPTFSSAGGDMRPIWCGLSWFNPQRWNWNSQRNRIEH